MNDERTDGFCVSCSVRQTPDRGRGVFAEQSIEQGQIVWRFVRNSFAVYDEARFTAAIAGLSPADVVHELTHVFGFADFPGCLVRIKDAGALINHDATPNLATNFGRPLRALPDPASVNALSCVEAALCEDRFALIAVRDIAAGEELTSDYTADVSDPPFYQELCAQYGVNEVYLDQV